MEFSGRVSVRGLESLGEGASTQVESSGGSAFAGPDGVMIGFTNGFAKMVCFFWDGKEPF